VKTTPLLALALWCMIGGCSSSFVGMKTRAQSPAIEEAFRKLTLATTVDGYEVSRIEPGNFYVETNWRTLKEKEKSTSDLKLAGQDISAKVTIHLDRRGALYDVFVTPALRYGKGELTREVTADPRHPLWEKWERVVNSTVQKESKEED
jgi:hypothetical protein